jgi:hypothetical protein
MIPPRITPFVGSDAIEKGIQDRAAKARQLRPGDWDTSDLGWIGLSYVEPGLTFVYQYVIDVLRKMQYSELFLFGTLLGLTMILWALSGAARTRRRPGVLEVPVA